MSSLDFTFPSTPSGKYNQSKRRVELRRLYHFGVSSGVQVKTRICVAGGPDELGQHPIIHGTLEAWKKNNERLVTD